jgi:hypothetical protein
MPVVPKKPPIMTATIVLKAPNSLVFFFPNGAAFVFSSKQGYLVNLA